MTPDEMDKRISDFLDRFIVAIESLAISYAKSIAVQENALKMSQDALAMVKENGK